MAAWNQEKGCTTNAMDWAICCDDVAIVKWFQANRTEGCTDFAMNYAAFGGHLEVLRWMSASRSEGRAGLTLLAAAQNGRLSVVQFCTRAATTDITVLSWQMLGSLATWLWWNGSSKNEATVEV